MKIPLYQVDAFTNKRFSGNPAAICPLEKWLPDSTLQSIAAENNLSETAFFVEEESGLRIRWFTPNKEVKLCGHATLAAAYVIFKLDIAHSEIRFNSKSGPLKVTKENDRLTLDFPAEPAIPCETPPGMTEALGLEPKCCFKSEDYLVILQDEETVSQLQPDFRKLQEIDTRGIIVSAPGKDVDFVSRFFAPKFGIDEDPVTGSAHCMLTPYWANELNKTQLSARQISKRQGELTCELKADRVLISGDAILYLEGTIEI